MGRKSITVDQTEWTIDEMSGQNVPSLVQSALNDGTVAELAVLDKANRQVTLYLNGRTATSVVIDNDLGARPSEISG